MLGNSIGDMVKCWEAMNNNLRLQLGNIRASFQKSFYKVEHAHVSPFYGYLRGSVSRAALRRIAEELLRVDYVGTNRQICGCTLRTSYGLPCACELGRYRVGGIPIPIDAVHVHWRKLTMEVELEIGEDDGSEVDMTAAMDELWRRFRSLDVIGKRALRSMVCELAYPTMTTLCPPPEKIKTKGGVKKKGKKPADYDVYRDPSYHEYVDKASQSSQRQSQPSQTSKKIKLSKKQPQFIVQFPNHIRSYIEDVVNVESDVVGESLMIESFGSQPPEKWMSLPDMGYLIANRYNVVLVCLGNPCITFFPMTSSHSPNVSIYCIGFVNQNHWVQVNMKEGFPLPPVTLDWKKFCSHIATTWMLGFAGRMQHWQLLTPVLA
ncbi:hypothetical protein KIW84_015738 [Lathyrus oleraceus]|uniref:Protein FAR1-RELATED SEQUENCE n=1 Tax=Pisum sativum TaxID=3888 RepID=A0A9D5BRD8_PEA|nr:hypothetical protein KIW84_015738 [Pisum sativum]